MNYIPLVILACVAMTIIIGLVYQALAYARGRQLISRRQFVLRLVNGFLLLVTIGMIFYVPFVVHDGQNLRLVLVYWALLTFLPLVVVILAWLDLRELARTRHQRQAELYRNLAEIQRELHTRQTGPEDT